MTPSGITARRGFLVECPKCKYKNASGATHCNLCSEVFNKSAADRYFFERRKMRRDQGVALPEEGGPAQKIIYVMLEIPVTQYMTTALRILPAAPLRYRSELVLAGGLVVLGVLCVLYSPPVRRQKLYGVRLEYRLPKSGAWLYLVGFR